MHWLTIVGICTLAGLIVTNRYFKQLPGWASLVCYIASSLMIIGGMVLARMS